MRAARFTLLICIVLVVLDSGCRGLPKSPAFVPKDASGTQVEQLIFHANFPLPSDHRLVRELVAERDDVAQTLNLPYTNEPIHVHLFNDAEAYGRYLEQNIPNAPSRRAFFVESDTKLSVYAHWSDRVAEDLRHEVAHGYLHAAVPQLPLWLDEGLAEYFEVPRGHEGLNRPHVSLLADMSELDGWRPSLVELERLSDARQMDQRHYAEAWAWAHFLLSDAKRRTILVDYLTDLREQGMTMPLSRRIEREHLEPEQTLIEHLAELKLEVDGGSVAGRQSTIRK